ncbi:MAG: protein phosphatase 2C domain-containing protein [Xenococcaceae cyanobacterium]
MDGVVITLYAMKGLFEMAAGSITGRNHWLVGKNNQDAYCSFSSESATIAVVCDGCGSGEHSEVGAKLGARLIVEAIAQILNQKIELWDTNPTDFWKQVMEDVLVQLEGVAKTIARRHPLSHIINDYFLFTVVGVLVTASETAVFSIGDGVIAVNGKVTQIGPFPNNAPPYLAYSLCGYPEWGHLQVHHQLPTQEVESILIGTDGVNDLIEAEARQLPGKQEEVGAIAQFWQEDRYFKNPDMIRRRLSLINREVTKPDWQAQHLVKEVGLLPDDTTLVVIRRGR